MKRALFVIMLLAAPASADETAKQCSESFEKAQYAEKDSKLASARTELAVCMRPSCPGFMREECGKILQRVNDSQPTVVFAVRDATGTDLVDVRVEQDGKPFLDRVTGSAVGVDPGEHVFRFVAPDRPPVEARVMARATEKNRLVPVTIANASSIAQPRTESATTSKPSGKGPIWPALVTGGAGLALVGISFGLGAAAQGSADHLRQTCAPFCPHADVSSVNTQLVASDVLLIGGTVVVGVAVLLFFARPGGHEAPRTALVTF